MDYEQERIELLNICQLAINDMMGHGEILLNSTPRGMIGNQVYPATVSMHYAFQRLTFHILPNGYSVDLQKHHCKLSVYIGRDDKCPLDRIIAQFIIRLISE